MLLSKVPLVLKLESMSVRTLYFCIHLVNVCLKCTLGPGALPFLKRNYLLCFPHSDFHLDLDKQ